MADTKLIADANSLTMWFALPNAFADPEKPTVAELSEAVENSKSIAWEGYSFGAQASNQTADPGWADTGNTQTRGFAQFGGTISHYFPSNYSNLADDNVITFLAFERPLTLGYLIIRADGLKTTADAPDKSKPPVANDFVSVYKVITDGWSDTNTGENAFKYAITFVPQGDIWINAVVATTVTVATPAPVGTPDYSVGGKTPLTSSKNGRVLASVAGQWAGTPGWFNWESSDSAVASVDQNGVLTGNAAGTTSVIARDKITNVASTALEVVIA